MTKSKEMLVFGAKLDVEYEIVDNDLVVNQVRLQGVNIYEILDQNLVLKMERELMDEEIFDRNWKHEEQGCHDYHAMREA